MLVGEGTSAKRSKRTPRPQRGSVKRPRLPPTAPATAASRPAEPWSGNLADLPAHGTIRLPAHQALRLLGITPPRRKDRGGA